MPSIPTRSALLSQLGTIIRQNLSASGKRRSDLPVLLGYAATKQPAKCLRRFDAVCAGNLRDADMVDRLVRSPLGGSAVATIIDQLRHLALVDRHEQERADEHRARNAFVPHIHALHERRIPEHPFFVIAMLGIDHFKRVDLPRNILGMPTIGEQLLAVWELMDHICTSQDYHRITRGPFGRATTLLFRDTYDHAYVYDVDTQRFIGEHHGAVHTATVTLSLKGTQR